MKAKYLKTSYHVYDKTVKCRLQVRLVESEELIAKNYDIIGIARCHKDDKFDFEIGKRVALAKAELKLHKKIKSLIEPTRNNLIKYVEELDNYITFANKQIEHNTEYLKEERYLNYKK